MKSNYMERIYNIEWYPTKESELVKRNTMILLSKPTGKTEIDAKEAVNIFTKSCGNLKKNTIIRIKEIDECGNQIGEDIVPSNEENAIIPSGR